MGSRYKTTKKENHMNHTYLLLGSNEGDRAAWLQFAVRALVPQAGTLLQQSGIYETAAWGLNDQPHFLNQVIFLATPLDADALLRHTQAVEQAAGRRRTVLWGQRTLDIDMLFFNDWVIDAPHLQVPHPFLPQRRFALAPLAEIAPGLMHPVLHQTMADLLTACSDRLPAVRID
jgi:2-amino-4-hydroxy-6-hydroxymethyldihydropteridine diphosphokinase